MISTLWTRRLQYLFIAIVTVTVGFSLYQWNASRAALKMNTNLNLNTNGLVGHWTLDGADTVWTSSSAGTTLDKSGNGNTGTLTNMNQATTPVSGRLGQGMNFDGPIGTGKYINFGSATSVDNIESQTGGGMTISTWINPRSTGGYSVGTIVGKATDPDVGSGQWSFGMSNSGNIKFEKGYSTTLLTVSSGVSSIKFNSWQHVLVTWDGSENASNTHIYINGIESNYLTKNNGVGTKGSDAGASLLVGGPDRFFDGLIDDVRIYNRALSASEVSDLYQMSGVKENTSALQPQGIGNLNSGLTGYWKFDDGSGSTAVDSSTNGNTGTLVSTPTWITGRIGGGLTFNGTNYVSTSQTPLSSTVPNGFSTFVWLQASNAPAWVYEMGSSGSALVLMTSSTGTYCRIRNPDSSFFDSPRSTITGDGNWHHFGCVFNRGANVLALYADGVSVGTVSTSGFTSFDGGGAPFYLGGRSTGSNGVSGSLDEMRIYNRALSADEISKLYQTTTPTGVDTGLKGYWSLDGNATNWTSSTTGTVTDLSGSNLTGTLTNMNNSTTPMLGKIGQGLKFDGASSNVTISSPPTTAYTAMTLSMWYKPGDTSIRSGLFGGGDSTKRAPFLFTKDTSLGDISKVQLHIGTASSVADCDTVSATGAVVTNRWVHIIGRWDGTTCEIYIDGVASGSSDTTVSSTALVGTPWYIGRIPTLSPGTSATGVIDEVRFYDRALSVSEIANLYQTGAKKINTTQDINTNGLVGHWTLDGKDTVWSSSSAGTTLDTSGNSNTGTLTNMSLATTPTIGKLGQAIDFKNDGSANNISIPQAASINNIEDQGGGGLTAVAWIKPRTSGQFENSTIVSKSNSTTTSNGSWRFSTAGTGFRFTKSYSTTVLMATLDNSGDLSLNKWQQVAVTWDGSSTASNVRFYKDGAPIANVPGYTNGVGTKVSDAANSIFIGGGFAFDGGIDDVRVYNRVLSSAEITALYTSGR